MKKTPQEPSIVWRLTSQRHLEPVNKIKEVDIPWGLGAKAKPRNLPGRTDWCFSGWIYHQ